MIVLMVFFLSAGLGFAGNGKGSGNGSGNGTGPIHDILAGEPFVYSGDVIGCTQGQGIEIATDTETEDGNVVIYGIGPVRYWDSLEVIRPDVGDTIEVSGYVVDYNGEFRNIAMEITIDGTIVQLRDSETGVPLWRDGNRKSN